jgi:5-amino-6-(5-phosphoribosylamino)uracil reductase
LPAPELRLVLAVSLDGRLAPAQGGAAQLGGPGDRRVLEQALGWADGCLIGARTLRVHGTTCLIHAADLLEQRRCSQLPDQPVAVVVSRSGDLDPALPFFRQPLQRWLLSPGVTADPAPAAGFDRRLTLQHWPQALETLAAAGLRRLVLLGGAELAGQLLQEQLVDELQLTFCPQLLGGAHSWLPAALTLQPNRWTLQEQRALGGDELLLRYRRLREPARAPAPPP